MKSSRRETDMKTDKAVLVISLDFELIWGVFDHVNPYKKVEYFENTLKLIPQLCEIFEKNKIAVTWATVGMLMHDNWEDWLDFQPSYLPQYTNDLLNPYEFAKKNKKEVPEYLFFAPDLVSSIVQTPFQEMATHTYSHYYCLENGESLIAFEEDLEHARNLAKRFNISFNSLVFPRNQYTDEHIKICANKGIKTVRINPNIWFWDNKQAKDSLFKKIFRTGDAYVPLSEMLYFRDQIKLQSDVILQPASRFYRPFGTSNAKRLLHRKRVFDEMTVAAKTNKIYHLWWHPHNFGNEPTACMKELQLLIAHYKELEESYGMQSRTMEQLLML